jgi:hypothetical protein
MPRKKNANTIDDDLNAFAQASEVIAPPRGITLDTEDEQIIWEQFTATRSPDSWRDFDLVLLAKSVKIEARIRKHQKELDRMGSIIENQRGTPIENPLFRIIDTLTRQQMAVIRSMSLNQTKSDPRVLNATGRKVGAAKAAMDDLDDDLIPRLRAVK